MYSSDDDCRTGWHSALAVSYPTSWKSPQFCLLTYVSCQGARKVRQAQGDAPHSEPSQAQNEQQGLSAAVQGSVTTNSASDDATGEEEDEVDMLDQLQIDDSPCPASSSAGPVERLSLSTDV